MMSLASGEQGLQKGKLLPKPKDAYRVSSEVLNFVAASIDEPLRVPELKDQRLAHHVSGDHSETRARFTRHDHDRLFS